MGFIGKLEEVHIYVQRTLGHIIFKLFKYAMKVVCYMNRLDCQIKRDMSLSIYVSFLFVVEFVCYVSIALFVVEYVVIQYAYIHTYIYILDMLCTKSLHL